MTVSAFEVIQPCSALILFPEAHWVTETATGLCFEMDTPIEVWGALVERLTRQHKRIEWALGDAINFGEQAYDGHKYEQWIEETGLSENTLSTMRWVAERIDPLRRRKDVGWSHHREVAALPPEKQDALLERAADKGMTRWEVRQAAKVEAEQLRGRSVTADGQCAAETESLIWVPQIDEVKPDVRATIEASAPHGRHRLGWIAGALWSLVWADQQDAFIEGRWRA